MANKIEISPEARVRWRESGGDKVITLNNLAFQAGRNGALHDFGAAPRPGRYYFKMVIQFETAPAVDETVDLYIREGGLETAIESPTNDDATGDSALSADKEKNLRYVGSLIVDDVTANTVMSIEGYFETAARHFGPTVFNNSVADNLDATNNISFVDIYPVPAEIQ